MNAEQSTVNVRWWAASAILATLLGSLQAPVVAVLWQLLLARSLRVELNPVEPWILALSVWLIYEADHLMDTARPVGLAGEPWRKEFCRQHWRRFFMAAVGGAGALVFGVNHFLWAKTVQAGWRIGVGVLAYMALVQLTPARGRKQWPREGAVAIIFTLGVSCAIWSGDGGIIAPLVGPGIFFALLVCANCSLIETWEWEASGRPSEETPNRAARWVAGYLAVVGLGVAGSAALLGVGMVLPGPFAAAVCVSGMALGLMALWKNTIPASYVSLVADLALCSPVLVLGPHLVRTIT